MLRVEHTSDIEEARRIWESLWPRHCLFDLWELRKCFHDNFQRPATFVVARRGGKACGLLPLSYIEEVGLYGFFPGETYLGKTWVEQNVIPASGPDVRDALLEGAPGNLYLRYLSPSAVAGGSLRYEADETGYLFMPAQYGYSFQAYMESLSNKFRKNMLKECSRLGSMGITIRPGRPGDLEKMYMMNLANFGEGSYFSDKRFISSFEALTGWLASIGSLTVTTVEIGGRVAAVDMGALVGGNHTVLAGATDPEFKGVAKIINLHHLERACLERFETVDFLCGDFGWKERFNLTPRILYKIASVSHSVVANEPRAEEAGLSLALQ